jgi:23S rRNA pseudouridine955/2504/2580 synthase
MRKLIVDEKYNNKKLNSFILDNFKSLNQNVLYKALRKKDIRINNEKISENKIIHTGDEITIYIVDELLFAKPKINLKVLYEDDNIIAFYKPENISVTEDSSSDCTFTSLVKEKYGNNLEPCHRLDRNTSGIILYSKNKKALEILLDKFKNKEIEKHYIARVYGIVHKEHEILTDYLFKDSKKSMVYISHAPKKDYVQIITEYTVINRNYKDNTTTLDINLHTGRTHQIRAHMAFIGYPIIGDGKYGNNEINKKFGLKTQNLTSYKIKFKFKTNSGILNYLNDKEIELEPKKYF